MSSYYYTDQPYMTDAEIRRRDREAAEDAAYRARAIARDCADLRANYAEVQAFATSAERAAIEAGFAAIEAADPIDGYCAYADAVNGVDNLIDALIERTAAAREAAVAAPAAPASIAIGGWMRSNAHVHPAFAPALASIGNGLYVRTRKVA